MIIILSSLMLLGISYLILDNINSNNINSNKVIVSFSILLICDNIYLYINQYRTLYIIYTCCVILTSIIILIHKIINIKESVSFRDKLSMILACMLIYVNLLVSYVLIIDILEYYCPIEPKDNYDICLSNYVIDNKIRYYEIYKVLYRTNKTVFVFRLKTIQSKHFQDVYNYLKNKNKKTKEELEYYMFENLI